MEFYLQLYIECLTWTQLCVAPVEVPPHESVQKIALPKIWDFPPIANLLHLPIEIAIPIKEQINTGIVNYQFGYLFNITINYY